MTLAAPYIDAIKGFEGFTPRASWDYKQHSNGYGTKARHAGEEITPEEAEARFAAEISNARAIVDQFAPGVPEGVKAALTSLTYNAGADWTKAGLGDAIRAGDYAAAKERFGQYNTAGGEVLPGLVKRRAAESAWFDGAPAADSAAVTQTAPPAGIADRVAAYLAPTSNGSLESNTGLGSLFGSLGGSAGADATDKSKVEAANLKAVMADDEAQQASGPLASLRRSNVDLSKLRAAIAARRGMA